MFREPLHSFIDRSNNRLPKVIACCRSGSAISGAKDSLLHPFYFFCRQLFDCWKSNRIVSIQESWSRLARAVALPVPLSPMRMMSIFASHAWRRNLPLFLCVKNWCHWESKWSTKLKARDCGKQNTRPARKYKSIDKKRKCMISPKEESFPRVRIAFKPNWPNANAWNTNSDCLMLSPTITTTTLLLPRHPGVAMKMIR